MRFWDSSAIVPVIVEETQSTAYRGFVTLDDALFDAADREGFEAIRPGG